MLYLLIFIILIGPQLKTGGTYRIEFIRSSVRLFVRLLWLYSKNDLRIFLKLGMKLGHLRGSKIAWPFLVPDCKSRDL